ncbi:MAG: hypothetical protein K0R54_2745 [Clostridiaceae bacterium]|jgi:hypothetical protein|nr:hypothetical protein [Clostridiaceae bacterium]MDF2950463.1 hypothetical protein [Anaerocolumna sp.]
MSISLEEARNKLDTLEKLAGNPELILTDLFTEGVSGSNFLYQINIDGKYILDYLKEYLQKISVLSDCIITNSSYDFYIYIQSLKIVEYYKYDSNDCIVRINADKRTFKIINRCIEDYETIMNKKYIKGIKTLDGYWIRFQNLNFKKRIKNAINSFSSNKKFYVKILDFLFWLRIKQSKVDKLLNQKITEINESNKYNEEFYNEEIERQNYYLQYAPKQIQKIKEKQKEISTYLLSIGYKEYKEMSEH